MVSSRMQSWYNDFCYKHKIDYDLFDLEAEYDSNITDDENITIIEEKLNKLAENGTLIKEQIKANKEHELKELNKKVTNGIDWHSLNLKTVFVTADIREGKTAFSQYLCEQLKEKKEIYVFKHPKPELLKKIGYKNLNAIDEVENLNNVVLWIDEPQIVFPKYEKRGSIVLNKLMSLAGQRDITLILSTSDTRYITSAEEFYVSEFIIKRIDYTMIKRGSTVKNILNELATLTPQGYSDNIKLNEFVLYSKKHKELNGKYKFSFPSFFNEEYSRPFS